VTLPVIGTLGAGRMGRGIATAACYAGLEVRMVDVKPRATAEVEALRAAALDEIRANLDALAALGALSGELIPEMLSRIDFAGRDEAAAALGGTDLLFEGVPEVIETKRDAFAFAVPFLRADAIVASTSSTFLSTMVAELVPQPARCLNAHWLNPAYLIPLVEVSPHPATAPAAVRRTLEVLKAMGKEPVLCAARAGYIVPRLQALLMNEAARMIEEGVATAEDIDRATRYGFGIRYAAMGVVEFIDFGGNDILYYASRYLAEALPAPHYHPPQIVSRYMEDGRLGLKSGQGFYDWRHIDAEAYRREALARLIALLRQQNLLQPPGCARAALTSS
jgi:3-hydroxybutyryl-CoA dehydrogenase